MISLVDEHKPRKFSLLIHSKGIVLCDDQDGAFMCLRFSSEVYALRQLLAEIDAERLPVPQPEQRRR